MKFLDLKLRMIALWVWAAIGMTAALLFVFFKPARLETLMSKIEAIGPSWFIIAPLYGLIPLVMTFLTITLKDRANKLTNRILSIIYIALILYDFVPMLLDPAIDQIIIVGSVLVAVAYLIFYSWKWPAK